MPIDLKDHEEAAAQLLRGFSFHSSLARLYLPSMQGFEKEMRAVIHSGEGDHIYKAMSREMGSGHYGWKVEERIGNLSPAEAIWWLLDYEKKIRSLPAYGKNVYFVPDHKPHVTDILDMLHVLPGSAALDQEKRVALALQTVSIPYDLKDRGVALPEPEWFLVIDNSQSEAWVAFRKAMDAARKGGAQEKASTPAKVPKRLLRDKLRRKPRRLGRGLGAEE